MQPACGNKILWYMDVWWSDLQDGNKVAPCEEEAYESLNTIYSINTNRCRSSVSMWRSSSPDHINIQYRFQTKSDQINSPNSWDALATWTDVGTGNGTCLSMQCGGIGLARTLFQVACTPFIICAIHIFIYIVQCTSLTSPRCMCIKVGTYKNMSLSVQMKMR